jgi:hypothetical protein
MLRVLVCSFKKTVMPRHISPVDVLDFEADRGLYLVQLQQSMPAAGPMTSTCLVPSDVDAIAPSSALVAGRSGLGAVGGGAEYVLIWLRTAVANAVWFANSRLLDRDVVWVSNVLVSRRSRDVFWNVSVSSRLLTLTSRS